MRGFHLFGKIDLLKTHHFAKEGKKPRIPIDVMIST
ncbi:hypothetical protein J2S21_000826 [Peribacillus cavernae]|nr:hypothetical protein [Peribacillus cavernae]